MLRPEKLGRRLSRDAILELEQPAVRCVCVSAERSRRLLPLADSTADERSSSAHQLQGMAAQERGDNGTPAMPTGS